MITPDNLNDVLNSLQADNIKEVYDKYLEYILLEVFIYNTGHKAQLTAHEYNEEVEQEANDNGQLFCDMDTFLQLVKESETTNKHLLELE
jgi:hypothetical protein